MGKLVKCINDSSLSVFIRNGSIYEVTKEVLDCNNELRYVLVGLSFFQPHQHRFVDVSTEEIIYGPDSDDDILFDPSPQDYIDVANMVVDAHRKRQNSPCPCGITRSQCTYHKE